VRIRTAARNYAFTHYTITRRVTRTRDRFFLRSETWSDRYCDGSINVVHKSRRVYAIDTFHIHGVHAHACARLCIARKIIVIQRRAQNRGTMKRKLLKQFGIACLRSSLLRLPINNRSSLEEHGGNSNYVAHQSENAKSIRVDTTIYTCASRFRCALREARACNISRR